MEFIKLFIKRKSRTILLFFLIIACVSVIFMLFNQPVSVCVYCLLICTFIGFCFLIPDYIKERRVYNKFKEISALDDITVDDINNLPDGFDLPSKAILIKLCEQKKEMAGQMYVRYYDMIEYYTMWAHQIKTPIASMRLNLQNEDTPLSRRMESDLFRIEQYVEMVMMYLRLDSSSTDYVFKNYDIDSIIKASIKKFSGSFINKKLSLDYVPTGITALTDEKWLGFVIEQILSNAIKYTQNGGIKIYGKDNCIYIQDTGMGISAEDLPRIFEKGYTGFNGRENKKASGLGLYLCKRICGNLGHGISVDSTVGEGTTVVLNLARKTVEIE